MLDVTLGSYKWAPQYFWTPCIYMIKSEKLTSFVDCSVMMVLESVCVIDRTVGESG